MPRCCWLGVLLLAGGVCQPARGQESVSLRWKFTEGNEFYVKTVTTSDQTMDFLVRSDLMALLASSVGYLDTPSPTGPYAAAAAHLAMRSGQEARQSVEQMTLLGFKVVGRKDDDYVLEMRVEALSIVNSNTPTAKDVYDKKLKDARLKVTFNPKMKVTGLEGYDDLVRRLARDEGVVGGQASFLLASVRFDPLNGLPLCPFKSEARRAAETLLPEEDLKRALHEVFGFVPEQEVKKGDTWRKPPSAQSLGPLGTFERTAEYTYEGEAAVGPKKYERISFKTTTALKADQVPAGTLPFRIVHADLKGESSRGEIYFDPEAGRLVESEMRLTVRGPLVLLFGEAVLDARIVQDFTVKTQLLDKKPEPEKKPEP